MFSFSGGWPAYVPVAKRRLQAEKKIKALSKKGQVVSPIKLDGKTIAKTFWGKAWCNNLERYNDYENRLPRGRTYVRNGFVIDLQITKGQVKAMVIGSHVYHSSISIQKVSLKRWKSLVESCTGQIGSMLELVQGKFSKSVMEFMTHEATGLFPDPKEISLDCSCPDGAYLCKHLAAVLYGVGARLDQSPELLFALRHVDHQDLITAVSTMPVLKKGRRSKKTIQESGLSDVFGIEIEK
ncbi:MAG: SWIM zinc finger family protein [Deltaproteobacteria bacterium]|nr:SWIM zinc finger family protein [Deltaproteobacteria bacterium]